MVKAHTRTIHGRPVKVRQHKRKLNPGRAWHNTKRAWRLASRKQHTAAFVCGSMAAAELGAWTFMRGTSLALTAVGIAGVGLGALARSAAR